MARIVQSIKLKRAASKNNNAKYKLTYKKIIKTEITNEDGKSTKYSYTNYKKVITPKKLSYT